MRSTLHQEWANCRSESVEKGSPTESFHKKIDGLNPSSSYIFRLYAVTSDGQEIGPGPEVAFDTEGMDYSTVLESWQKMVLFPGFDFN